MPELLCFSNDLLQRFFFEPFVQNLPLRELRPPRPPRVKVLVVPRYLVLVVSLHVHPNFVLRLADCFLSLLRVSGNTFLMEKKFPFPTQNFRKKTKVLKYNP